MLGRYEAAVRDFDRAIELDPADDDVYYQRGMARVELGEYLKAVEDFAQASMLNPDHPQAEAEREFAFDLAQSAGRIFDLNSFQDSNRVNVWDYVNEVGVIGTPKIHRYR